MVNPFALSKGFYVSLTAINIRHDTPFISFAKIQTSYIMKKLLVLSGAIFFALAFQFCSGGKASQKSGKSKVTYDRNIKPLMQASCTPCHFPPDGNKKAASGLDAT